MNEEIEYKMQNIPLQMIVAMDAAGGIGYQGKLPWPHNPKDMAHFKKLTEGSVVVMGRKTFEEIEEINNKRSNPCPTLLSDRKCVVVSNQQIISQSKIFVEKTLNNAVEYHFSREKNIFVIGGLQMYMEALSWVNTIHATVFNEHFTCDKYLPLGYLMSRFDIVEGTREEGHNFIKLQRVR